MYLKINSLEPSSVAAVAPDRQANEQQSLRGLQEVVADKGSQQRRADGLHGVGDSFLISEPGGGCATAEAVNDSHSPENRRLLDEFLNTFSGHITG